MKARLLIAGRGNLAHAIAKQCAKEKIPHSFWEDKTEGKYLVVLYCGSNRLFKTVSSFCTKTKTAMMLLSTDVPSPKNPSYPLFLLPNTSQEVQQFIKSVCDFASKTKYSSVSIIESHQRTKKDISGTARLIAKTIGASSKIITSIRDTKTQLKLGVPKKYLEGHAYHQITFHHDGVTTTFTALVLGRETYAKGAIEIAKKIIAGKYP